MSVWPGKYIIGVTGNICVGKSEVCKILADLGAQIIDADIVAHDVMKSTSLVFQDIVAAFGVNILDNSGEIDRKALGKIVFSDKAALKKLELLVHPIIRAQIEDAISNYKEGVIVVEAFKLLETGLSDQCDSVWVVNASYNKRLARLTERDNINIEEAQKRLHMQSSQELKLQRADVIIENESSLDVTYAQIWREWGKIVLPK